MSASTTDKAKLLAKSAANLKRTANLAKAFGPPPASGPVSAKAPVQQGGDSVNVIVAPVEGEAPGTTGVRKVLKQHIQPAVAMHYLCHGSPEKMGVLDYSAVLREFADKAASGDLSDLQRMLTAQALVLDGLFTQFAIRAHSAKNDDAVERMLRIALKAQSQSRTTVESLAVIQQGPAIFARQANVSNGGNQQVNNGAPAATASRARTVKVKPAKQTIPKVAP